MIDTVKSVDESVLAAIAEEMAIRQTDKYVLLFPLGSQFDHLILQACSKRGVYCQVVDPNVITATDVLRLAPAGIILSGGPASVYEEPPTFDTAIFDLGIPVLGICLGFQLWAQHAGATVAPAEKREYGVHTFRVHDSGSALLTNIPVTSPVMQSHFDEVYVIGTPLTWLGSTDNTAVAAASYGHLYGVQFHPEVSDTEYGLQLIGNFCHDICGITQSFPAQSVAMAIVADVRTRIAGRRGLIALSGGTDSAICAAIVEHAIASQPGLMRAIYIKGVDRDDDLQHVIDHFGHLPWLDLKIVDATEALLAALAGHEAMRDKRLAFKVPYRDILEREAADWGAEFIVQGTLYTDISESGRGHDGAQARKAVIKHHHNVDNRFSIEEINPLIAQVKDTGRAIGAELGVPEALLYRQPFPGPGLVVRIAGEIMPEKLAIARAADAIYIAELRVAGLYDSVWQSGAFVSDTLVTVTKGDGSGLGRELVIWAVWSVNGFTATWADLPNDFLRHLSKRLTNEIADIGVVTYRISDKPPTTIEFG